MTDIKKKNIYTYVIQHCMYPAETIKSCDSNDQKVPARVGQRHQWVVFYFIVGGCNWNLSFVQSRITPVNSAVSTGSLDLRQEAKSSRAESAKQVLLALVLAVTNPHSATHSYAQGGLNDFTEKFRA